MQMRVATYWVASGFRTMTPQIVISFQGDIEIGMLGAPIAEALRVTAASVPAFDQSQIELRVTFDSTDAVDVESTLATFKGQPMTTGVVAAAIELAYREGYENALAQVSYEGDDPNKMSNESWAKHKDEFLRKA